jgi:hypothetical protein
MYLVNLKIQFVVVFFHLSLNTKGGFFLNILGIGGARFYSLLSFERTVATARAGGSPMWDLCDLFYLRWFLIDGPERSGNDKIAKAMGAKGKVYVGPEPHESKSVHYKGGARDVPYGGGK